MDRQSHAKRLLIYASLLFPAVLLFLSTLLFKGSTAVLGLYKVVFLLPFAYHAIFSGKSFRQTATEQFSLSRFRKFIPVTLLFAAVVSSLYAVSFLIIQQWVDFSVIVETFNQLASVDASNVLFFGIYVIFFNSLFEEFFWRGFVFSEMTRFHSTIVAHAVTGIAFSLHHIVYAYSWVSLPLLALATLALAGFAIVMNLFFAKTKDLFSCWFVHACADIVQITIGLYIFGLI